MKTLSTVIFVLISYISMSASADSFVCQAGSFNSDTGNSKVLAQKVISLGIPGFSTLYKDPNSDLEIQILLDTQGRDKTSLLEVRFVYAVNGETGTAVSGSGNANDKVVVMNFDKRVGVICKPQ